MTDAPSTFVKETLSQIEEILRRVQGEFLKMPGLRLAEAQAGRLWGRRRRHVCGFAGRTHCGEASVSHAPRRGLEPVANQAFPKIPGGCPSWSPPAASSRSG